MVATANLKISDGSYDGYWLGLSPNNYLQAKNSALQWHFIDKGPYYQWTQPDYGLWVKVTDESVKGSSSRYLQAGVEADASEFNIKTH